MYVGGEVFDSIDFTTSSRDSPSGSHTENCRRRKMRSSSELTHTTTRNYIKWVHRETNYGKERKYRFEELFQKDTVNRDDREKKWKDSEVSNGFRRKI